MPSDKGVTAKKHLGQHFLNDENIASKIVDALLSINNGLPIIEIGPGTGVLTDKLYVNNSEKFFAIDVDKESIELLHKRFPNHVSHFILGDFLTMNLSSLIQGSMNIIGNFPYNISSQIIFKILENRDAIPLMVGMFQKEVAERITAEPRNKSYGILSVLTQAYYHTEYLFTVNEDVFIPPPKVKSGVIRITLREDKLSFNPKEFSQVVKTAFNQRRKKLRNALSVFGVEDSILKESGYADKRAEELSVNDFIQLTELVYKHGKKNS